MSRVYISGAISNGGKAEHREQSENVEKAIVAFVQLVEAGYSPICPQLTWVVEQKYPGKIPYERWLEIDLPWVEVADAVLRLPGESYGSDVECKHAESLGIPVCHSIPELSMKLRRPFEDVRVAETSVDTSPAQQKATGRADHRFLKILDEMRELHIRKAADYGRDEDPLANLRATESWGIPNWVGAMIRMSDKLHRARSLFLNGSLANESIIDTFNDIAAYAILSRILFEESHPAT